MEISKEYLLDMFLKKDLTIQDIAKDLNCSQARVRRKLKFYNIRKNKEILKAVAGDRFGGWEIIKLSDYRTSNRQRYWVCKCDCGYIGDVATELLQYTSLGCRLCHLKRWHKKGSEATNFKGCGELGLRYFNTTRDNAKSRNLEFNLDIKDLWNLFLKQERKCALTGLILTWDNIPKNQTASLDRIDSLKGYTIDNVQWVHKYANYMKMDFTQEEYIRFCHLVAKTHPKEKL